MPQPSKHLGTRVGRITRNAAVAREVHGTRAYLSATRRYDAPPEAYTGSEAPTPPPSHDTPERAAWEKKIGELRARGLSYLNIAVEVDSSEQTVRDVCILHGFVKGERG